MNYQLDQQKFHIGSFTLDLVARGRLVYQQEQLCMTIGKGTYLRGHSDGSFHFHVDYKWNQAVLFASQLVIPGYPPCIPISGGKLVTPASLLSDEHVWASVDENGKISFPHFSTAHSVAATLERVGGENEDSAIEIVENMIEKRVSRLSFDVDSVSVFVLTNIIFPEAKVMETTKVYIPGDLVVLGQVVKDYNPIPTMN